MSRRRVKGAVGNAFKIEGRRLRRDGWVRLSQAVAAAEVVIEEKAAAASAAAAAAAASERRLRALEADFVRARDEVARLEREMVGAAPSFALAAARAEVERLELRMQSMVPKLQLMQVPSGFS